MSLEWNALLPSLLQEFAHIGMSGAQPSEEEAERLQSLERASGENCQVLLDGLSSLGAALANAAPELDARDVTRIGFFVQYVAALAGDLAAIHGTTPDYLSKGACHE